jgi:hypothetical protein
VSLHWRLRATSGPNNGYFYRWSSLCLIYETFQAIFQTSNVQSIYKVVWQESSAVRHGYVTSVDARNPVRRTQSSA